MLIHGITHSMQPYRRNNCVFKGADGDSPKGTSEKPKEDNITSIKTGGVPFFEIDLKYKLEPSKEEPDNKNNEEDDLILMPIKSGGGDAAIIKGIEDHYKDKKKITKGNASK